MSGKTVPLRHAANVLVSNVDKKSAAGEKPVRLVNYTDVYYQSEISPELDLMRATATTEQVRRFGVLPGDSIITKDSETSTDIAVPAFVRASTPDMVCGYHLALVRPAGSMHPKYVYWALASDFMREQFSARANGMTRFGLTYDAIQGSSLPFPPFGEQRRIADFLDDQVARIDAMLLLRDRQIAISWEAEAKLLEETVWSSADRSVEIRRLGTTVTTGPFGSSFSAGEYVSGGVPMINPTHIQHGALRPNEHESVGPEVARRLRRHRLRAGDIVTARKGDLGRSAMVTEVEDGWICGSDSIAIHVDSRALDPEFLDTILHLPSIRSDLVSQSPGATMPSLNEGMLTSVRIPDLSLAEQAQRARAGRAVRDDALSARSAIRRSIDLLNEYKRSLITAAVLGEFDVTTARTGVPA